MRLTAAHIASTRGPDSVGATAPADHAAGRASPTTPRVGRSAPAWHTAAPNRPEIAEGRMRQSTRMTTDVAESARPGVQSPNFRFQHRAKWPGQQRFLSGWVIPDGGWLLWQCSLVQAGEGECRCAFKVSLPLGSWPLHWPGRRAAQRRQLSCLGGRRHEDRAHSRGQWRRHGSGHTEQRGSDIRRLSRFPRTTHQRCASRNRTRSWSPAESRRRSEVSFSDCDPESHKNTGFKPVDEANQATVLFQLTATPPSKPSPNWALLYFLVSSRRQSLAWFCSPSPSSVGSSLDRPTSRFLVSRPEPTYDRPKVFDALPKLDASWKFSEKLGEQRHGDRCCVHGHLRCYRCS